MKQIETSIVYFICVPAVGIKGNEKVDKMVF